MPQRLATVLFVSRSSYIQSSWSSVARGLSYRFSEVVSLLPQEGESPAVHAQDFAARLLSDNTALLTYRSTHVGLDGTLDHHALRPSVWQHTARLAVAVSPSHSNGDVCLQCALMTTPTDVS